MDIREQGSHHSRRVIVVCILLLAGLTDAGALQVDPDQLPGSPGSIVKTEDPTLYTIYRRTLDVYLAATCDACLIREGVGLIYRLREIEATLRPQEEIDYIVATLRREMDSEQPRWEFLAVALNAARYGTDDPYVYEVCRHLLSDLPNMTDERMVSHLGHNAVYALGHSKAKSDREFLSSLLQEENLAKKNGEALSIGRRAVASYVLTTLCQNLPNDEAIELFTTLEDRLGQKQPMADSHDAEILRRLSRARETLEALRDWPNIAATGASP